MQDYRIGAVLKAKEESKSYNSWYNEYVIICECEDKHYIVDCLNKDYKSISQHRIHKRMIHTEFEPLSKIERILYVRL